MTHRLLLLLAAVAIVAGCERERGAGFTGIGKTTQARASAYSLDFAGLTQTTGSAKTTAQANTAPAQ